MKLYKVVILIKEFSKYFTNPQMVTLGPFRDRNDAEEVIRSYVKNFNHPGWTVMSTSIEEEYQH